MSTGLGLPQHKGGHGHSPQTTAYGRGEVEVMCALNAHLAVRLQSYRCLPSLKKI